MEVTTQGTKQLAQMKTFVESLTPETLYEALRVYGEKPQQLKAIEELNELTTELVKNFQGRDNTLEVIDELADVFIMLVQMVDVFGIDAVQERIQYKINRLEQRLNKVRDIKPR